MEFVTPYTFKPDVGEKLDPTSEVESAGYIPAEKRIEAFFLAGERLREVNESQFDYTLDGSEKLDDKFEFQTDPTRDGNFDFADAQRIAIDLKAKKDAYEEALKASQTAQDGSGGDKTPPPVVTDVPSAPLPDDLKK